MLEAVVVNAPPYLQIPGKCVRERGTEGAGEGDGVVLPIFPVAMDGPIRGLSLSTTSLQQKALGAAAISHKLRAAIVCHKNARNPRRNCLKRIISIRAKISIMQP